MDNSDGLSHSSNGVSPGGFTNVVVTIGRLRVTRAVERRVSTVLMHVIRLSQSHSLPISGSGSWPKKHEKSSRSRFVLVKNFELDLTRLELNPWSEMQKLKLQKMKGDY